MDGTSTISGRLDQMIGSCDREGDKDHVCEADVRYPSSYHVTQASEVPLSVLS